MLSRKISVPEEKQPVVRNVLLSAVYIDPNELEKFCSISYTKKQLTSGLIVTEFVGAVETTVKLSNGRPAPLIVFLERFDEDELNCHLGTLGFCLLRNISQLSFTTTYEECVYIEGGYPIPSANFDQFVSDVKTMYFN